MKILLSQVIWPNSPRRVSSSTPNGSSLYPFGFLRFTLSYNLCAHITKITTFSRSREMHAKLSRRADVALLVRTVDVSHEPQCRIVNGAHPFILGILAPETATALLAVNVLSSEVTADITLFWGLCTF